MKDVRLPVSSIEGACERQLCTGCGACAAVEPQRYRMGDDFEIGRRPFLQEGAVAETGKALAICPGVKLEHIYDKYDPELIASLAPAWGPVYEVWEGYATDDAIRLAGSSGGAASALALHCLENEQMHGVLHTGARRDVAYLNETVLSTNREELLSRTGSRYAPASPCDGLGTIEGAPGPCVFIGKPCDAAAASAVAKQNPALAKNLGLTIAFFCAGTPSTRGTLELLEKAGVDAPERVRSLRYRGNGWPGMWRVEWTDHHGKSHESEMTYAESWGFLQSRRQWRCYICPDHTGEFADIAVGDPWYREVEPGEPGKSLIVARTKRGRDIILAAANAGHLTLETNDSSLLPRSQPNLLSTRGGTWGRLLVLRAMGAGVPVYKRLPTFRFWFRTLSLKQKLQSIVGTAKRVKRKRLRERITVSETVQQHREAA